MCRCLLSHNFVRLGKWFVQPYDGSKKLLESRSVPKRVILQRVSLEEISRRCWFVESESRDGQGSICLLMWKGMLAWNVTPSPNEIDEVSKVKFCNCLLGYFVLPAHPLCCEANYRRNSKMRQYSCSNETRWNDSVHPFNESIKSLRCR